jgi:Tol biopolymer transport system component
MTKMSNRTGMDAERRPRYAHVWRHLLIVASGLAILTGCAGGGSTPPPSGSSGVGLSISSPVEGQVMSGTVAVAASGIGGAATSLSFGLGSAGGPADPDGTTTIDTRGLSDGAYQLEATAVVAGREVRDSVTVSVINDLPSSGGVGAEGGSLKSSGGSYAALPPGALERTVSVSVRDTTQEEILDEFGIDYPALGVTFLGSLTVEADADRLALPVRVDLAGWAQAVQPGQQVVMFSVAPDASGNGVGELMFASDAQATPDGSVVTRPTPRSEVYGFGDAGVAGLQTTLTARPGAIVSLVGRGFNAAGGLSNVARFTDGPEVLVVPSVAEDAAFNPLMLLQFALPALGGGSRAFTLHNLTTGYRTDAVSMGVGTIGSGTAATFASFAGQVRTAAVALTTDRPDLAAVAAGWLHALEGTEAPTAWAMAANSGLVSAHNAGLLGGLAAGNWTAEHRTLVLQHALVLDAMAASVADLRDAAADLATLLVATAPEPAAGAQTLQAGGGRPCVGATTSWGITFGAPTGMGSAAQAGCLAGFGSGGGGFGGASTDAATQSARPGTFGPVSGAIVVVYRTGTTERLTPFTAITDGAGYFYIPFVPALEPFTIQAFDPFTGRTATTEGVSRSVNVRTPAPLVFTGDGGFVPGSPTAALSVRPDGSGSVGAFSFDGSASRAGDDAIAQWVWSFGNGKVVIGAEATIDYHYPLPGTFTAALTVIDTAGRSAAVQQTVIVSGEGLRVVEPVVPPSELQAASLTPAWTSVSPMSADGRYVLVTSRGPDLTGLDRWSGDETHLYRVDMVTGETLLVDETATGEAANADLSTSGPPAISGDGRRVAFGSTATNLAPVPENAPGSATPRIFVKDLESGAVTLVKLTDDDVESTNGLSPTMSADGRLVGGVVNLQVRVRDLESGAVVAVTSGNPRSDRPQLSADGSSIVFDEGVFWRTYVQDVGSGSRDTVTISPITDDRASISGAGRYVAYRTRTSVDDATLAVFLFDRTTLTSRVISDTEDGAKAAFVGEPFLSADGRWAIFNARYSDTDFRQFLFVADLETGAVVRADRTPTGADPESPPRSGRLSADGRFVTFHAQLQFPEYVVGYTGNVYRTDNPLWRP